MWWFFPFFRILLRSFCFRLYKMYLCGQRSTIPNCAFDLLFDLFFFIFVRIHSLDAVFALWFVIQNQLNAYVIWWQIGTNRENRMLLWKRKKKSTKQLQSKLLKLLLLLHKIAIGYCPFVVFFFVHISVICIAMHTVTAAAAVVFHFLNSCLFLF